MAVLNKHHYAGKPWPNAVNIMRGTPYGNPFVMGTHGDRAEVVEKFRQFLWGVIRYDVTWQDAVLELHGKDLMCCCAPLPCHGDVLERASNWLYQQRYGEGK